MIPTPPKAILFGSVGTLAEMAEVHRRAYNAAFAAAGLDWTWTPEIYAQLQAHAEGAERIARFARERGETVEPILLYREQNRAYMRMMRSLGVPLRPGVAALIAAAKADGRAVALVTTAPRSGVDALLSCTHPPVTAEDFACIVTAEQVERGKPDPECYLTALKTLDLAPGEVVAIEDSPCAAAAAIAAGIKTFGFPGRYHTASLFPGAQAVVAELDPAHFGLSRAGLRETA
ncbi:HAD-IA family hydrolase [Tropicimonas sp. IMCC34011]|uniref:HAD-IA family hydrolase n=1 Tax=Tropicimonas sp. IMCC34011 TaxID=2248759 RepID=UPI000E2574BA|nr:HAD-IA family hydrolase [Tropicimonas sp. IMCC34011]